MNQPGLNPGERVIELAAFTRTVAVIAAAVAGGVVAWMAKHKGGLAAACVFGGAILGYFVGYVVSQFLFPSRQGHVVVTKVGAPSLPLTLKGGLCAGPTAAIIVSILLSILLKSSVTNGLLTSIGIGLVAGTVTACLSSLA